MFDRYAAEIVLIFNIQVFPLNGRVLNEQNCFYSLRGQTIAQIIKIIPFEKKNHLFKLYWNKKRGPTENAG